MKIDIAKVAADNNISRARATLTIDTLLIWSGMQEKIDIIEGRKPRPVNDDTIGLTVKESYRQLQNEFLEMAKLHLKDEWGTEAIIDTEKREIRDGKRTLKF